jgi:hypothetical protein
METQEIQNETIMRPGPILVDKAKELYNSLKNRLSISYSVTRQTGPTINVGEEFKFEIIITNNSLRYDLPYVRFKNIHFEIKENRQFAELISLGYNSINIPVNQGKAEYLFQNSLRPSYSFILEAKMKARFALSWIHFENIALAKVDYELNLENLFHFSTPANVNINLEP